MIAFSIYALFCLLAITLNRTPVKQHVCGVCFLALLGGLLLDPFVQIAPAILGYSLVFALNAVALTVMRYTRDYYIIPLLFYVGLGLCFYGALCTWLNWVDDIPYVILTHALNIIQILVLVIGSDRVVGVLNGRTDADSDGRPSYTHGHKSSARHSR